MMTIDEMRNKLDKFCEGFDLCIDGCPLRKPDDGSCRWNNLSDKSTEDCYHFLEGLIGKPEQPEINFVKVEHNDDRNKVVQIQIQFLGSSDKEYVSHSQSNLRIFL